MGSPWPRYDIHYESPGVPDPPPHWDFRDVSMTWGTPVNVSGAQAFVGVGYLLGGWAV